MPASDDELIILKASWWPAFVIPTFFIVAMMMGFHISSSFDRILLLLSVLTLCAWPIIRNMWRIEIDNDEMRIYNIIGRLKFKCKIKEIKSLNIVHNSQGSDIIMTTNYADISLGFYYGSYKLLKNTLHPIIYRNFQEKRAEISEGQEDIMH